MERDLLSGPAFNSATLIVAIFGLIIAIVGLIYGRRALFPPSRRLTIFTGRRQVASPIHRATTRTRLILGNTGRHAIEPSRFSDGQPVVIELGAPVKSTTVSTNRRSLGEPQIVAKSTRIEFGPDLLNPKEHVAIDVDTDGEPNVRGLGRRANHSLLDTIVDGRIGAPPSMLTRRLLAALLAVFVLAPVALAIVGGFDDVRNFVLPQSTASISPDHGPAGTCVIIRGENFGQEAKITLSILDTRKLAAPGAAKSDCPAFPRDTRFPYFAGDLSNRSTFDGLMFARFTIPEYPPGEP